MLLSWASWRLDTIEPQGGEEVMVSIAHGKETLAFGLSPRGT